MPDAIVLEHLSKQYPGSGSILLHDLNIAVETGEFVSLMGPSGSGKSTLLNLVAGLDTPTTGRVCVAGNDLAGLSDDARSALRLRDIGIVFQSFNLFPTFTVTENVIWPLEFLGVRRRESQSRARSVLAQVGLKDDVQDRRPLELSGGEQQRVAIARALVTEPQVLLADEPTGNLDSQTGQMILDLLRQMNRTRTLTVLMVTHNTFAAAYGHRTLELRDGRIVREARAPRGPGARVVTLRE
jgi:putative ABC transport system ATP-binding protein